MSEHRDEAPDDAPERDDAPDDRPEAAEAGPGGTPPRDGAAPERTRPSLTSQVRRRRTDQAFFLRLRDAIAQNHRALERLGT
jgi:hypothetical protein